MLRRNKFLKIGFVALVGVLASFVVACSGGVAQSDYDTLEAKVAAAEQSVQTLQASVSTLEKTAQDLAAQLSRTYLQRALAGEFKGTSVSIYGPCRDVCGETYNATLAPFIEKTGINVRYDGDAEFETNISTLTQSGQVPDIVDFPQPGVLQGFVTAGKIVEVTDFLSLDYLNQQYLPGWVEASTLVGPDGEPFVAGVWSRTGGTKSLVWYAKDDFDAAGYEIPETWDELVALTNQIKTDGGTPWCIGIESGAATGWTATDWTEDLLLRTTSLENYDNWTVPSSASNRLLFDSPQVRRAIELWSDIWFTEGNVVGGRDFIVSTSFGTDSSKPLFTDPPGCYLHRQAAFVTGDWRTSLGAVAGVDFDAFYLPPVNDSYGRPFLISGDLNAMFNDRPEVRAVLEFHATADVISGFVDEGSTFSPFRSTQLSDYASDTDRRIAQLLTTATALRFDGSDLQPKVVGAGAFWNQITEYIAGNQDLGATLRNIDAAWPN